MRIKTTRELANEYCDWHGITDRQAASDAYLTGYRQAVCDAYVCGFGTAEYQYEHMIKTLEQKVASLESALEEKNENT